MKTKSILITLLAISSLETSASWYEKPLEVAKDAAVYVACGTAELAKNAHQSYPITTGLLLVSAVGAIAYKIGYGADDVVTETTTTQVVTTTVQARRSRIH